MTARDELLEHLVRYAYQYRPEKPFLLASGIQSDEYLDCKLALSQPRAMAALGKIFLESMDPSAVAIGGLTMGSDPIAMSTCMASASGSKPIRWFTVRKEPKSHGQKKLIEGAVTDGERIVVVDDVVTSGKSTIQAIKACRNEGLKVVQVLVLVDRQQDNGLQSIRNEAGVSVSAIFTRDEIRARWMQINQRPVLRATA